MTSFPRIRELRQERGLTQAQLAVTLDMSVRTYRKYESMGNFPLGFLVELALFYNVSTDYILGRTDVRTRWRPTDT